MNLIKDYSNITFKKIENDVLEPNDITDVSIITLYCNCNEKMAQKHNHAKKSIKKAKINILVYS